MQVVCDNEFSFASHTFKDDPIYSKYDKYFPRKNAKGVAHTHEWYSYMMCSIGRPKNVSQSTNVLTEIEDVLKKKSPVAIVHAFGYNTGKLLPLNDVDLESLHKILINKKTLGVNTDSERKHWETVCSLAVSDQSYQNGEEYIQHAFGEEEPPILTHVTFMVKSLHQGDSKEHFSLNSCLTVCSSNVIKDIQQLIRQGKMKIPLPQYIEKLSSLGKNTITLLPRHHFSP